MRTTLSIDDDVLYAAKDLARRERVSLGAVISRLARAALVRGGLDAQADANVNDVREPEAFYGFRPLPKRSGVVITNAEIDALRDDGPY